jgi:phage/plasmid-like protein (TIGR03299 family)
VSKRPLQYLHNGIPQDQTDAYALVRDDTGACLGSVGSRYQPIQNKEGFAFLDSVRGQFDARYITAGAVHNGKRVWMQVLLPNSSFSVAAGDEVEATALFLNPHDGSGCAECYPTTKRVVCNNTLRVSLNNDRHKGISLRHTGNIKARISDAQNALAASVKGFADFRATAETLARVQVPHPSEYVDGVLAELLDVGKDDNAQSVAARRFKHDLTPDEFEQWTRQFDRELTARNAAFTDIMERYEGERCNANGIGGTAWAVLNAVTEHADYSSMRRKVGSDDSQTSRRFESILNGDRDEMKQIALSHAKALAV